MSRETPTPHRDTPPTASGPGALSDHDPSRTAAADASHPPAGTTAHHTDGNDQADVVAASTGGYALLHSAVDGWELYHGDELLAGHHGIDAGDVDQAQKWADELLADEHQAIVTGWSTRPHRDDPDSVEHAAAVASRATVRLAALDVCAPAAAGVAGHTRTDAALPRLPELLTELAGLDELATRRRVHEIIRLLGGAPVAVQQEYREALCPTYMRPSDWKSALAEAKQHARAAASADTDRASGDGLDKAERGPSQAEVLAGMARRSYSFHTTPDGEPFALPLGGPRVARLLRGGRAGLRAELSAAYLTEYRRPPSSNALADTLGAIEGLCAAGDCLPTHVRVAEADGAWWLDLGRRDGLAVRIDAAGWQTTTTYPVVFRRTGLTGELPIPTPRG